MLIAATSHIRDISLWTGYNSRHFSDLPFACILPTETWTWAAVPLQCPKSLLGLWPRCRICSGFTQKPSLFFSACCKLIHNTDHFKIQGMGFLAGLLLLYMSEEDAFWLLVALLKGAVHAPMEGLYLVTIIIHEFICVDYWWCECIVPVFYDICFLWAKAWICIELHACYYYYSLMRTILFSAWLLLFWTQAGLPLVQQYLFQFERLVKEHLPKLGEHFSNEMINPSMYASQWFITVFSYSFPFHLALRIWDVFLYEVSCAFPKKHAIRWLQTWIYYDDILVLPGC